MDPIVIDLYRIFLKPNIYRRQLWRCERKGDNVLIVFYNDYEDVFEEYLLEPHE